MTYATGFAAVALGTSLVAFDDHPGQLYRLWHVVTLGPAPWAWNSGWWTGYPELQFYPPAFAYAGALLHALSVGTLPVPAAYQSMLWLAYLAPGVTAWLALRRALDDGWLALPGAFVALTLSLWPALMSGVEGGVRVGMAPARLGWALLPLLALGLQRWSTGAGTFPAGAVVPVTAAIALVHPAHLPGALALVALAALARPPRARRAASAAGWLALGASLTAFWALPLLVRLAETRPLAWGALTLAGLAETMLAHPLLVVLTALAGVALLTVHDERASLLARFPPVMVFVVALDALVLEPWGVAWLPADRLMDGLWLALVLAAGIGTGDFLRRFANREAIPSALLALGAVAVAVVLSLAGRDTLTLWPRAAAWPTYAATERGLRLPALWGALRAAPEGRVLFIRSGVPLSFEREWWRPHTHVTALTPRGAGREIVNGTFTHSSPIAALVYRGTVGPGPITTLVERLDGVSLFGRPLEMLDAPTFNLHARQLRVSTVVALDEDLPRLGALADNPEFPARRREPPFVVWTGGAAAVPVTVGPGHWRARLDEPRDGWAAAGVAYYPLWQASVLGRPLPIRRGTHGDLEVQAPAGSVAVDLRYGPALAELSGLAVSALGLVACVLAAWRRKRR
jgi:hypothetical protein